MALRSGVMAAEAMQPLNLAPKTDIDSPNFFALGVAKNKIVCYICLFAELKSRGGLSDGERLIVLAGPAMGQIFYSKRL
jgi:hypothetical protein